ncbi:unnamed protein product, partial [Prorocentrum cordatum]
MEPAGGAMHQSVACGPPASSPKSVNLRLKRNRHSPVAQAWKLARARLRALRNEAGRGLLSDPYHETTGFRGSRAEGSEGHADVAYVQPLRMPQVLLARGRSRAERGGRLTSTAPSMS